MRNMNFGHQKTNKMRLELNNRERLEMKEKCTDVVRAISKEKMGRGLMRIFAIY